jgi:methionine aminopeptidase
LGDKLIYEKLAQCYAKKKKMEKGIAFPTCVSVNEICGHYSPLVTDANDKEKE